MHPAPRDPRWPNAQPAPGETVSDVIERMRAKARAKLETPPLPSPRTRGEGAQPAPAAPPAEPVALDRMRQAAGERGEDE